ncbi:helix-turn-helix domain-containing protein [Nitrosovibrio sp. Nv6]|uniref:LuxR C-terminal-related transcriptional regulator n=1 Tax=Nitrosovibrio sp. Nv6 TaxID=1855340 RepID=UPI000ADF3602|nr:helix-turn-helix domain-containing protein [Nitrosovibrio sp. Nv6]
MIYCVSEYDPESRRPKPVVVVFGRRLGQRVKSDKLAPKVLALVAAGQSYRQIGRQLDLSKNTVLEIVKRQRANKMT